MIQSLNEMIGLPITSSADEVDNVSAQRFNALLDKASAGDRRAQCELVALRIAYLNWAYAGEPHAVSRSERA